MSPHGKTKKRKNKLWIRSRKENKEKERKMRKGQVAYEKGKEGGGRKFPTWNKSVREKKNRGEKGERGKQKREDFPAFRLSKPGGLRIKVGPRNEIYAWVPKSKRFIKL